MAVPVWALLVFATWTVVLLLTTVGIYRWSRILTGRVPIKDFRADQVEGQEWYKRSMRAHANCIENLPVFGAIVFALTAAGIHGPAVNYLCAIVPVARVGQSLTHVCFPQTNLASSIRFSLFLVQIICFLWLIAIIFSQANLIS